MAKQKGLIKIEGELDGLSFYKSNGTHFVKMKSGVSKDRIMNDPSFQRTRENGSEFGSAAKSAKLLRLGLRPYLMNVADRGMNGRLQKRMMMVRKFDVSSSRGDRNVALGLVDPLGKLLFKDFDFNERATLKSVLYATYLLNVGAGSLSFSAFNPLNDVRYPDGATHMSVRLLSADVSFADDLITVESSLVQNLALQGANVPFSLSLPLSTALDVRFFLVYVEFFQEVNGVQYSLRNGSFNVLNVLEVV